MKFQSKHEAEAELVWHQGRGLKAGDLLVLGKPSSNLTTGLAVPAGWRTSFPGKWWGNLASLSVK